MRSIPAALMSLPFIAGAAFAGEAEVRAAQGTIEAQIGAFRGGDNAAAYGHAAPSIKRIFPTLESFMGMVTGAYQPVYRPRSFAFGKAQEAGSAIAQQVMIVGPDGRDYEALYTLELQPDGRYRITGVSLKASNALSM
ncbi:DUF4864 domain-containing protein [Kumtagia ephedrae]|jgi:hypothetical protein|uniref:DUF4864 domain-containing protein n=1 Tax=Kumtagia ephedrae TaxID=2116701 RepID=A0A2P7SBW2_9HYPH|nr:DUF4864 domain-containing protein [Mesorhizobium ephedrae]PSJ59983.1 DUF4864 domain-containing protein [Mesorhizobium ephedrae]